MIPAGSSDEFKAGHDQAAKEWHIHLLCERDRTYDLGYKRRGEEVCEHYETWHNTYQWQVLGHMIAIITVCEHCDMVLFAEVV